MIAKKIGCNGDSTLTIYFSVCISIILAIVSCLLSVKNYFEYKSAAAKLYAKKHLSSEETAKMICVNEFTHEDFKIMAEYYMKNPHFAKRLNLEKGKIVGYNPKIKIDVPKNVDTDFLFNIRINFTPGYVTIPDDKD